MIAQPLNYSGNSSRSNVGRFRSPEIVAGPPSLLSARDRLHSSLPTARSNLTSLVSPPPSSRARPKVVRNPTRSVVTTVSGSSPKIYKISSFYLLDSLAYLFSSVGFRSDDPHPSLFTDMLYIAPTLNPRDPSHPSHRRRRNLLSPCF